MIQFSGNNAARLALNILKSVQQVVRITRLPGEGKERVFVDCVSWTLHRGKILADMVRLELKRTDTQEEGGPAHFAMLQKLLNLVVNLRDLLIATMRIARKGLYNSDSVATVLNNTIRNTGRTVKEIIMTAKEIESLFPKDTGSVLDSITQGEFRSSYVSPDDASLEDSEQQQLQQQSSFVVYDGGDEEQRSMSMTDRPCAVGAGAAATASGVSGGAAAAAMPPQGAQVDVLVGALSARGFVSRPETVDRSTMTAAAAAAATTVESAAPKLETGIELFNIKWKKGLQFLIKERLIKEDTKCIAQFLLDYNDRLSKEQMGEILAGRNEDDVELLAEFTRLIDFRGDAFDQGLRKYLKKFMLPGEAQKISRIMEVFAMGYLEQNPAVFPNQDVAFVLAFSLIMLNTDAHNPAIAAKDKMTKEQFIKNNRGTWVDGADPPKELLEELYDKIVNDEIKMQTKGDPDKKGWLKAIHAGSIREARRWFLLVGNELRWYKVPVVTTTGKEDEMRGKIVLECIQVREDEDEKKFSLSSVLPNKNIDFFLYEKGGKETILSCKRIVISAESPEQTVSWAKAIRTNVSLEEIPSKLEPGLKNFPKTNHRKPIRPKNQAWRNSLANGQAGPTPGLDKQPKKKTPPPLPPPLPSQQQFPQMQQQPKIPPPPDTEPPPLILPQSPVPSLQQSQNQI